MRKRSRGLVALLLTTLALTACGNTQYAGEINVLEQEAIGGIAGMEYTTKGKDAYKLKNDETTKIYENKSADFWVKATQRDNEYVVLEFSDTVIYCDSEQDFSQEIEKERLDKGKEITIDYPYGTGGIRLTMIYQ